MKKWILIAAAPVAFFIGLSAGISTQVEEPEIKTVTKTETVEVTPQACLQAVGWGEEIAQLGSDFAEIMIVYPDLVSESFEAGIEAVTTGSTTRGDQVIEGMRKSNRETNKLLGRADTIMPEFRRTAEECREAAK